MSRLLQLHLPVVHLHQLRRKQLKEPLRFQFCSTHHSVSTIVASIAVKVWSCYPYYCSCSLFFLIYVVLFNLIRLFLFSIRSIHIIYCFLPVVQPDFASSEEGIQKWILSNWDWEQIHRPWRDKMGKLALQMFLYVAWWQATKAKPVAVGTALRASHSHALVNVGGQLVLQTDSEREVRHSYGCIDFWFSDESSEVRLLCPLQLLQYFPHPTVALALQKWAHPQNRLLLWSKFGDSQMHPANRRPQRPPLHQLPHRQLHQLPHPQLHQLLLPQRHQHWMHQHQQHHPACHQKCSLLKLLHGRSKDSRVNPLHLHPKHLDQSHKRLKHLHPKYLLKQYLSQPNPQCNKVSKAKYLSLLCFCHISFWSQSVTLIRLISLIVRAKKGGLELRPPNKTSCKPQAIIVLCLSNLGKLLVISGYFHEFDTWGGRRFCIYLWGLKVESVPISFWRPSLKLFQVFSAEVPPDIVWKPLSYAEKNILKAPSLACRSFKIFVLQEFLSLCLGKGTKEDSRSGKDWGQDFDTNHWHISLE